MADKDKKDAREKNVNPEEITDSDEEHPKEDISSPTLTNVDINKLSENIPLLSKLNQLQSQIYNLTLVCLNDMMDSIKNGKSSRVEDIPSCSNLKSALDSTYSFAMILRSVNSSFTELTKTLLSESMSGQGLSAGTTTSEATSKLHELISRISEEESEKPKRRKPK